MKKKSSLFIREVNKEINTAKNIFNIYGNCAIIKRGKQKDRKTERETLHYAFECV